MVTFPTPTPNTRLGMHYYPDTLHYRESDLKTWLPELKAMGVSWVTLLAPSERAIPEVFIQGLVEAQIEPVLHLPLSLTAACQGESRAESLRLLFNYYARRDIHYIAMFDRPNLRAAWPPAAWTQTDLVERFLDIFTPLAETALSEGLIPVFPPLEPGGDYWDLAFLRSALRGLERRGRASLLDSLAIGAYAWAGNRPLNWGAGGPERWPGARPYYTPPGVEDQRGFRIFDWYNTLIEAELGAAHPILLLRAGSLPEDASDPHLPTIDQQAHTHRNLSLIRLLTGEVVCEPGPAGLTVELEPLPENVLACNFWLLSAAPNSPFTRQAWFLADGSRLPIASALQHWQANRNISNNNLTFSPVPSLPGNPHPITHYLLLPLYAWGVADWDLDFIRPFVQAHHPTVGFSLAEAGLAARVTVLGDPAIFSDEVLEELRQFGCQVERLVRNGTNLAP